MPRQIHATPGPEAAAGIRARHPEYDQGQTLIAYARLTLGDELTRRVWPDRELVEP